jgi:hypothetical protein
MLPVLSALALGLLASPHAALAQTTERSMVVSVVDQSGAPVSGLGPTDFIVREDNVSREVLRVAPADEPMQVAILVDNSAAANSEIPNIRRALPGLVEVLSQPTASGRHNQIAIVAFAARPTILADFTADRARLDKAIALVWEQRPASSGYLLDAINEVTQGFKKRQSAHPVIIVITAEGPDPGAGLNDRVLTPVRETGTNLHVISLGRPSNDVISDDGRALNRVINDGPAQSGGSRQRLLIGNSLPETLRLLGEVLTHQYRVTYAHPDSLIPPDRVTVSARRADLTARGLLVKDPQAHR